MENIIVKGARENNLKNIDITIPKDKLVVITGVSGSGKSSLAFDTIYAEGERRYIESLSSYARQFLGNSEKPDVDSIEGLSPAISIDQKTTNKNPRSTVGTITEIYDYLRLLYARIATPYCPVHKVPISSQTIDEMVTKVYELELGSKLVILAPVVDSQKGTHKELLEKLRKDGFTRIRVNGVMYDLNDDIKLEKNKKDKIDVVIDRIVLKEESTSRITEALEIATKLADGKVIIDVVGADEILFSSNYACPLCNYSLPALEPRLFSFNSPYGACEDCKGLGVKLEVNEDLVIPNREKSINQGGILPFSSDIDSIDYQRLLIISDYYKIDLDAPISSLKKEHLDIILYGSKEKIPFKFKSKSGNKFDNVDYYEGIIKNLNRRYLETSSTWIREWIEQYMIESVCESCLGARLNEKILSIYLEDKNIFDLTNMSIEDLHKFISNLTLDDTKRQIGALVIKEITDRLAFLINVGLNYLSLSRSAATLSGGESQRIRLATQIGSRLTGVLYVLDEPSIGLHQKDNERLIKSLKDMRDIGNSLIVVEHDTDTMLESDYLIDIGPYAGDEGGYVVSAGTPSQVMNDDNSITGKFLSKKEVIEVPKIRRKGTKKNLEVLGASENNLKNINVKIPLGTLTCVTGVSGSGKSTLVNEIIYKATYSNLYKTKLNIGKHKKIKGMEHIDKVIEISQAPIGRTPRSNPATYTSVFDDIREIFTNTRDAKIKGYDKGRFSFNVRGGRCEACRGEGTKKIEMHFLPDVYVACDVCGGTRYNKETLTIKYKGKNIHDVLNMRVKEAYDFFENVPIIKRKLQVLLDVGLGYIKLGQSATTLSGGEASRVKLAKELQKKPTGKTLFILDEPTTGLHTYDVRNLLAILNRIVDNKDTVLVIEHNLDVIKVADYIIDLGKEGGINGGEVLVTGTPEDIVACKESYTGQFLKDYL